MRYFGACEQNKARDAQTGSAADLNAQHEVFGTEDQQPAGGLLYSPPGKEVRLLAHR